MTRRGIGLLLESDFFATEKGKQAFAEHLVAIQMSVQETENYDVMFALLTTDNMSFKYEMDRGLVPRRHLIMALKDECAQFAITQKDGRGFERMIEATKQKMGLYHVYPDSLIMAPQLSLVRRRPAPLPPFLDPGVASPSPPLTHGGVFPCLAPSLARFSI